MSVPGPEIRQRISNLSDGNPGCINVLCALVLEAGETAGAVLDMVEQAGLRGADVWLAFRDYAKQGVTRFLIAVMAKDAEMLAAVRRARGATS